MYLKRNPDGSIVYPYAPAELRRDHPNTSFPRDLAGVDLSDWGVFVVLETPRPVAAGRTYYVEGVPELVDGQWRQTWEQREIPLAAWREGLVCSPVQFRLAALQLGLLDQIEAVAAGDAELRIRFEYGTSLLRSFPAFDALAPALGRTPEDIDALFELARTLD
ncbi:MAG: hypothetical protein AB7O63_09910 [Reyranellaceae bacterium]